MQQTVVTFCYENVLQTAYEKKMSAEQSTEELA